jgi:hypothetical protein
MKPFRSTPFVLGLGVAVAACAGLPETTETMLASSGFATKAVTTQAQKVSFNKLPQGGFTKMADKGKTLWVYRADPTICTCIYVGDQQAYNTYLKKAAAKPPIEDPIQGGSVLGGVESYSAWADNPSPYAE